MLDFKVSDTESRKRTHTTQIRHDEELGGTIERASIALGVDKSVFLRSAIQKEADRVIQESTQHILSEEDLDIFERAMETPPKPTELALKAASEYKRRVIYAE